LGKQRVVVGKRIEVGKFTGPVKVESGIGIGSRCSVISEVFIECFVFSKNENHIMNVMRDK
jgi:hypothetical protein